MTTDKLRYPIGQFNYPKDISREQLDEAIMVLQVFPEQLKHLIHKLKKEVLDQPYRHGGWTIRQLVHHIADSHHHAYNRLRWALSEEAPVIKAYNQDAFADLEDYKTAAVGASIAHLEAVHQKMVYILESLTDEQWNRIYRHPSSGEDISLKTFALLYSWHSLHHYSHISNALESIRIPGKTS